MLPNSVTSNVYNTYARRTSNGITERFKKLGPFWNCISVDVDAVEAPSIPAIAPAIVEPSIMEIEKPSIQESVNVVPTNLPSSTDAPATIHNAKSTAVSQSPSSTLELARPKRKAQQTAKAVSNKKQKK